MQLKCCGKPLQLHNYPHSQDKQYSCHFVKFSHILNRRFLHLATRSVFCHYDFFSFSRISKKWNLTIWSFFPVLSRYNWHTALYQVKVSIIMIWLTTYCKVITTVSLGKIYHLIDIKNKEVNVFFLIIRTS